VTRSKLPLIAAVVAAGVVAAGIVAVVGIAFGGSNANTASKAEYQATVVNARDRVDFALERITKSQSIPELIQRIKDASVTVHGAASELDRAKVAKGFEGDNAQLATTLRAFSATLAGTASTFSDPTFGNSLTTANSLSFPEWDTVNTILADMKSRGIEVEPLARH
jgi:hypothetical protein